MAKLMARARRGGPWPNLRVYGDDAAQLLEWLPAACLERIDLLYPDPGRRRTPLEAALRQPGQSWTRFARVMKPAACSVSPPTSTPTSAGPCCCLPRSHGALRLAGRIGGRLDDTAYEGWPGTRLRPRPSAKAAARPI